MDCLTSAQLLVRRELEQLPGEDLGDSICVNVQDDSVRDAAVLHVSIRPVEGPYACATFRFRIHVPFEYPFEAPKVRCLQRVLHPNIEGPQKGMSARADFGVCLNVLRLDWSPVLGLRTILLGLLNILLEPSHEEPLESKPADLLLQSPDEFERIVKHTLAGGVYDGVLYDNCYSA